MEITEGKLTVGVDVNNMNRAVNTSMQDFAGKSMQYMMEEYHMKIDGNTYCSEIVRLTNIANMIVNGGIPNFMKCLPVTKQGLLPKNRFIEVADSLIKSVGRYDGYVSGYRISLVLDTVPEPWERDTADPRLGTGLFGVLKIKDVNRIEKASPIINRDGTLNNMSGMTNTDRPKYLKDSEVRPGGIYRDKDGKDWLYLGLAFWGLGNFTIIPEGHPSLTNSKAEKYYMYLPYTKKMEALLQKTDSLQQLYKFYLDEAKKKGGSVAVKRPSKSKKFVDYVRQLNDPFPAGVRINM